MKNALVFRVPKHDAVPLFIIFIAVLFSTLMLPVNPWPIDGWFETQYRLFGHFPGQDNYTPIAAPAVFYKIAHWISRALQLDMAGEFYTASILQNALLFLSGCFVFYSCQLMGMHRAAGATAIVFILFVLSTGLTQAFWSESTALFLTSALLLLTIRLYSGHGGSPGRFFSMTVIRGVVLALLVATRIVPILFIPALAMLFYQRISNRQLLVYTVLVSLITALGLALMAGSNYERFGRFELTNSSGKHLWQGVTPIVDRALSHSPEYQVLKAIDPNIEGKPWWDTPDPQAIPELGGISRERLLGQLAKEAIINEPWLYIKFGLKKFAQTVGEVPYQLGYGTKWKQFNPLNTEEFLPPIGESMLRLPAPLANGLRAILDSIWQVSRVLYPVAIFFVLTSWYAMYIRGIRLLPSRSIRIRTTESVISLAKRKWGIPVFFVLGVLTSSGLAAFAYESGLFRKALVFGLCTVILVGQTRFLSTFTGSIGNPIEAEHKKVQGCMYTFLIVMFFGSMWVSWQLEFPNSRNVLPYLPLAAVMVALALSFWFPRSTAHVALEMGA